MLSDHELIQEVFDRGLQSEIPGYNDDDIVEEVFDRGLQDAVLVSMSSEWLRDELEQRNEVYLDLLEPQEILFLLSLLNELDWEQRRIYDKLKVLG